ncbi:glucose-6-phosphate isomerase [Lentisphaerota bacterium WC36G]|nr:glucose-6-phosphate isomerase [Lentisphaerae bacterium WC36]
MSSDWTNRVNKYTITDGKSGFSINFAGMKFSEQSLENMNDKLSRAFTEMKKLEAGEIKNPDENRQVTHFTDRIEYPKSELFADVEQFVEDVRTGKITGSNGKKFEYAVINGIGGSALGPQLMQYAINGPYYNELSGAKRNDYLKIYFLDNTDSSGFSDVTNIVNLEQTLVVNISKSGGTQETKNNLLAFEDAYKTAGIDFTKHAVAITMLDSQLDKLAKGNNWLKVFEMAESIGGRTSETSIVGHLPAALSGVNFKKFLAGACYMDDWTRKENVLENPAAMLSAMWYIAGEGKGDKNMVIVPYSDRLLLLSRYFQQLIMESLGKEFDLDGKEVYQGINVFGNKGGTDAHAFIQQLNDGRDDFFVTFIESLEDTMKLPVEGTITMGDYLHGFQAGLSAALRNKGRQVMSITIERVDEFNLGMIIALYERATAMYAEYININAFHQPGVQAYKLASSDIINLIIKVEKDLETLKGSSKTATEIAAALGCADNEVNVANILNKLSLNNDKRDLPYTVEREFVDNEYIYNIK